MRRIGRRGPYVMAAVENDKRPVMGARLGDWRTWTAPALSQLPPAAGLLRHCCTSAPWSKRVGKEHG